MRFRENAVAVLSPGQGTKPGLLAEEAYRKSPRARKVFEVGSKITALDLPDICFGDRTEELSKTEIAQPAISCSSLAEFFYLEELGFLPDAGEGHSMGEIPLLAMAEIISVEGMYKLIKSRAVASANANNLRPGILGRLAGLNTEQAEEILGEFMHTGRFFLTNFNSKLQHMVAGDVEMVELARDKVREVAKSVKGLKDARLSRTRIPAFHSPYHMGPARRRFGTTAKSIKYSRPKFDVMLNNGMYIDEVGLSNLPSYLAGQLVGKVLFTKGTERLVADGIKNFVQVGGQPVLGDLIKEDYGDAINIVEIKKVDSKPETEET